MPDLEFSFYDINLNKSEKLSDNTVNLTLEPADYMITINQNTIDLEDGKEKNCVPGIGDTGNQFGWNLGIMFLRRFMMIYDFKNEKIGFVRTNNDL